MKISNFTLMKIAAIGGFATAAMGFALRRKINDNIAQTEYYREAMKDFRNNNGVKYLMGQPIRDGAVDVSDYEKNYTKPLTAHYEVPVYGPKNKGILYFWANRRSEADTWSVTRIELQLRDEPDRRLLVKNIEIEGTV